MNVQNKQGDNDGGAHYLSHNAIVTAFVGVLRFGGIAGSSNYYERGRSKKLKKERIPKKCVQHTAPKLRVSHQLTRLGSIFLCYIFTDRPFEGSRAASLTIAAGRPTTIAGAGEDAQ